MVEERHGHAVPRAVEVLNLCQAGGDARVVLGLQWLLARGQGSKRFEPGPAGRPSLSVAWGDLTWQAQEGCQRC